jgi:serine/threonine protein phosphatase 1
MPRTFAIGDIHGCSATFQKLLLEEIRIEKSDEIYCLGDYIDRGEDSKGVIDFILKLRHEGFTIHTLRGNHEEMMMEAFSDGLKFNHWLKNGGDAALRSFGVSFLDEVPQQYIDFIKRTKYFIATREFIFVHAGLNFRLKNPFLDKKAMLWTRDEYFDPLKINNRMMIHGHTPLSLENIRHPGNRHNINIDGGCVYNYKPGYGNLIALSLPDMKIIVVPNIA